MRRGEWGRGPGPRSEPPPATDAPAWIGGALPEGWFTGPAEITIDRDEILIVGRLSEPSLADDAGEADRSAAEQGRIAGFRETTRDQRIGIAQQLERRYQRKVAWGVRVGETRELFTTFSAPVMTRLRQPERQILDTLVDSGVARSRSDAVVWAVRLLGQHADSWLGDLRHAMEEVNRLRDQGPDIG